MEESRMEGLLVRYYDGCLTEEELAQVGRWLRASDANRKVVERVYCLCFACDVLETERCTDTAAAFARVRRRIRRAWWRGAVRRAERVAALLLLPLAAVTAWALAHVGERFDSVVEIRSTTGMVSCVTLPDSTRVWLNSDSFLRYPARFGKERRVALCGEGYFDVAEDRRRFVVEARAAEVEVHGTEFNVEAYAGDCIRTTLVSGSVEVKYDDQHRRRQSVRMMPGQQVIYDDRTGALRLDEADIVCSTSWKEGRIVLDNTSLEDALRMIGNKYNVRFLLRNERLRGNKFTGTFSNQSLDVILRYFTISSNIRFRQLDERQAAGGGMSGRSLFEVL